jgi:type I restriction enzyme M protein
VQKELTDSVAAFQADVEAFHQALAAQQEAWKTQKTNNGELKQAVELLVPLAETSLNLVKQIDLLYKLASHMNETGEDECNSRSRNGADREITRALKAVDETRQRVVLKLKQVRYSWRQGRWLTERFPDAKLRDVEGLVKLVTIDMIAHNDWSLTPGRYVGVAPEEVDENFDFEEALHEIHVELEDLNAEAVQLAATIKKNFEELGA